MKQLSVLIKPASSLCNMRCAYCFYADVSSLRQIKSYGIMKKETMRLMVNSIYKDLSDGDSVTFAFQGGEPTIAGLPWFEDFINLVAEKPKNIAVFYALQTNGFLIDDAWCGFLKKHHFLVGLSLDGPAEFHNKNRLDANNDGTFATIINAKRLLQKHNVEYNILCVLSNEIARSPQKIWKFIIEENVRYIQFIPCMDDLEGHGSKHALKPERFASFYNQLFPLWAKAYSQNNYYSIKQFDDIINLIGYGIPTACGISGQCQPQYVIEADGSVYPCDFYVLDENCVGNVTENTLKDLFSTPAMQAFLTQKREHPPICKACQFWNICAGGCKRMSHAVHLNKSKSFCGYQQFLLANWQTIENIARHFATARPK